MLTNRRSCVTCEVHIYPPRDRKRDNRLFHHSFDHATFILREEPSFTQGPRPTNFSLIFVIPRTWNSSKSYLAKLKTLHPGSSIHLHKDTLPCKVSPQGETSQELKVGPGQGYMTGGEWSSTAMRKLGFRGQGRENREIGSSLGRMLWFEE